MLLFGQIAPAMANVPPAREFNDRAVPFGHVGSPIREPRSIASEAQKGEPREPAGECFELFFLTAPLGQG
jgi:hypothetical protein